MAIVVEHDKRKHEILEKALDVFVDEGYEDATFQKIADRCGITRTTLYLYFKNKREIFMWSIKQVTQELEERLQAIINQTGKQVCDRLTDVVLAILDCCVENRKLFSVILMYLLQLQKMGKDPAERVHRRVLRMRHLTSSLIIEGIDSGELKNVNVKAMNELLYALIESTVFRLAILDQKNVDNLKPAIAISVQGICK